MDTLESMRSDPHFAPTVQRIREAGTDNLSHFKNGYTLEGGYSLQQNPDEFAALVCFLRRRCTRLAGAELRDRGADGDRYSVRYLEIGTASAGTMRFLFEELGFCLDGLAMIDDHGHHRWPEQERNLLAMYEDTEWLTPRIESFIGDSHGPAARDFLAGISGPRWDIAFVDGDHRYEGVRADIELVLPHMKRGGGGPDRHPSPGVVLLHDIIACPGDVGRAWREAIDQGKLRPLAEFVGAEVPLGIAVGEVAG